MVLTYRLPNLLTKLLNQKRSRRHNINNRKTLINNTNNRQLLTCIRLNHTQKQNILFHPHKTKTYRHLTNHKPRNLNNRHRRKQSNKNPLQRRFKKRYKYCVISNIDGETFYEWIEYDCELFFCLGYLD